MTYRGKPLSELTNDELEEAVNSIPYQSLAGEIAIRQEVTRRERNAIEAVRMAKKWPDYQRNEK